MTRPTLAQAKELIEHVRTWRPVSTDWKRRYYQRMADSMLSPKERAILKIRRKYRKRKPPRPKGWTDEHVEALRRDIRQLFMLPPHSDTKPPKDLANLLTENWGYDVTYLVRLSGLEDLVHAALLRT